MPLSYVFVRPGVAVEDAFPAPAPVDAWDFAARKIQPSVRSDTQGAFHAVSFR